MGAAFGGHGVAGAWLDGYIVRFCRAVFGVEFPEVDFGIIAIEVAQVGASAGWEVVWCWRVGAHNGSLVFFRIAGEVWREKKSGVRGRFRG